MRLAIADPPYPPHLSERYDLADGTARIVSRSRARRYYGDGTRPAGEQPADHHPDAGVWDDPAQHRALLERLHDDYDGWALATCPDGLRVYHPLPVSARIMVWAKPTAPPGSHRITTRWEPVIVSPPRTSRARSLYAPQMSDVLTCNAPQSGFAGAKPARWTRWVLNALGYDPEYDTVADLFPGSGAISAELASPPLVFEA